MQARLGLVIAPLEEMVAFTKTYDLGICSETFNPAEIAEKIKSISQEDILRFKNNSGKAAEFLCAESNREIFLSAVREINV